MALSPVGKWLETISKTLAAAHTLTAAWLFRFSFHDCLQVGQTLIVLITDHFFAVHDQADRLGHKVVLAGHAPGHVRLIADRFERELNIACSRKWANKIELDANSVVGLTFENRHAAGA